MIHTRDKLHCPRCDYSEIEGTHEVSGDEGDSFFKGVNVGMFIALVTMVGLRLMGWAA